MINIVKLMVMGALCTLICFRIFGQGVVNNTLAAGGDVSLYSQLKGDDPSISFYLSPYLEYYVISNLSIGAKYVLDFSKITDKGFTKITTKRIFHPYLKYYFFRNAFALAGTQIEHDYRYQSNIHTGLGYTIFISRQVGFIPLLEVNHNFYKYAAKPWQVYFSMGACYYFNSGK